jgi:hypothetical protein
MRISEDAGWKEGRDAAAGVFASASCCEMRRRRLTVVAVLSGFRAWYDSMTNAVRTAEKSPACVQSTVLVQDAGL